IGCVTRDAPSVVVCIPNKALGVDRQAIWIAVLGGQFGEHPAVSRDPGFTVEVVPINAPQPGITQIHGSLVQTPGDPVHAGNAAVDAVCDAVAIQSIDGAGSVWRVRDILGTGPESPRTVHLSVVEAIGGDVGFGMNDSGHAACLGVEEHEAGSRTCNEPAVRAQSDA